VLFTGALFTVIITLSEAVAPLLSVTVNLKVYEPAVKPVIVVDAALAEEMVPPVPETFDHA
jgi:hypothetical protein